MSSVDAKALVLRQAELAGPIERAVTNLKKVGEANLTKRRIQGRLDALKSNWKLFKENHTRIVSIRDTVTDKTIRSYLDEHEYLKDGHVYLVEEAFLDAQEYMDTRLDAIIAEEPASGEAMAERSLALPPGATPHGHRLPAITIPKFDGTPRNWVAFRDLFHAVIGSNPHLTNVEKLHYLKAYVTRVAAQRIESIALSNENFVATWNYLASIYDDKRLLVNTAMRDLFETKPVVKTSGTDLDRFNGEVSHAITSLESLGQYDSHCDAFVIFLVVSKLDANTVREWEESLGSTQLLPTLTKLLKFLEIRARTLQAFEIAKPRQPPNNSSDSQRGNRARQATTAQSATPTPPSGTQPTNMNNTRQNSSLACVVCGATHYIASCQSFRNSTPEQRKAVVAEKQLCFNGLGFHRIAACRSQKRCQICNGHHHTLIHQENTGTPQESSSPPTRVTAHNAPNGPAQPRRDQQQVVGAGTSAAVHHVTSRSLSRKNVLLTTASIRVQSSQGTEVAARALIDTGSELSFISEPLAQLLRLSRERMNIPLVGIGAQRSGSTRGAVSCTIRSHFKSSFSCQIDALTLPKLTADLPTLHAESSDWKHLRGLKLADPDFAISGRVDLILGSDIYRQLIDSGVKRGSKSSPVAHLTKLGWVLSGPTSSAPLLSTSTPALGLQCSVDLESSGWDLQNDLQRFWLQEEVSSASSSPLSTEEEACEAHFLATHSRDVSGRYVVHLPFKSSPDNLGDSRTCALRILSRMQKRLESDTTFRDLYSDFLRNYESLGHMRPAPEGGLERKQGFYLPHHGVLRDSTTTKLRVVFNGSARTTSGQSLNDILHTGAKLQTDLSDVLLRWQRYQFAFSADIEKMFRQILVHHNDWDYQRILWNSDNSPLIREYQLTTVTYGLGPAPFLAIRVLRQLVEDEGHRFPLAADIIRRGTYVDDTFGGADNLQDAQRTAQQLHNLCMAGGFKLQKWSANYAVVLSNLPQDRLETSSSFALVDDPHMKTLGIIWKPTSDSFEFSGVRSINTRDDSCKDPHAGPLANSTRLFISGRILRSLLLGYKANRLAGRTTFAIASRLYSTRVSIPLPWTLLDRYSSLNRLLRVTATCRRLFLRKSPRIHPLTPLEIESELYYWVRVVQRVHFNAELNVLSDGGALQASNPLVRFIPFLDSESGLLRLGGHLRNAILDPDTKHPLILPKDWRLAALIIAEAHEKTLHGGTQATLAYIRRRFWIVGGRAPVRSHILRCVRCTRYRGIAAQQLTGQLPRTRSTPSRPFHHSGVDYAGPLNIKAWCGRTTKTYKGYIVLFVCFATSAVHLEAVTDYSTNGFLAAFKRFTGRRGICATLSSDCGTNLIGADTELRKLFTQSSKELGTLAALLANDGTEWRFNPPSAPHFGGKWEAGVKSVKFHLRRIMGDHVLTYEELSTLLIQIEAVLNSRPPCPLSDDIADLNALTPGHFLVGSALTTVPEPSLATLPVSRLSRWQLVTQMLDHFWSRWTSEYLQRFQAMSKWTQKKESVKPGSLVLLIDQRYPRSKWPLARVIETHPGADGLVRVVKVKTQTSTFKWPIVKLCPLPVRSPEDAAPEL